MIRSLLLFIPMALLLSCTTDPVRRAIEDSMRWEPDPPQVKTFLGVTRIDSVSVRENVDRRIKVIEVGRSFNEFRMGREEDPEKRDQLKEKAARGEARIERLNGLRAALGAEGDEIVAYTYAYEFLNGDDEVEVYYAQLAPSNAVISASRSQAMLNFVPAAVPGEDDLE